MESWQTQWFSSPSFTETLSGATLTGGADPIPPTGIYWLQISYAPDGDIAEANDAVNGKWVYIYDDMNRLLAANCSSNCPDGNGSHFGLSWDYDRFGNRWDQNVTAGSGLTLSGLTFNGGNNRMDHYSYDASGDLLNDGLGHNFSYDAEGQLACVYGNGGNGSSPGAVDYFYDAAGHRAAKCTMDNNGQCASFTSFLYDLSGHIVSELSNGAWQRTEAYLGGRHLATYGMHLFKSARGDHH